MAGLDAKTIVDFFKKEAPQIGITFDFLINPQTDQLIQAYQFLCDLIFEDIGSPEQMDPHMQNDKFGSEQVVARPTMIVKITKLVSKIFESIYNGIDEFYYTDLLAPDPRRTRNFLSQMIRFYNFTCDIAPDVVRLDNEIEEHIRIREFEKAQEKGKKEKLKRDMEQLAQLQFKKSNLAKALEESKQNMEAMNVKLNSKKKEREEIKKLFDETEAKMNDNKKKFSELENIGKRLDMNIVTSPDRIIAELDQLKQERENFERELERIQQTDHKLERDFDKHSRIENCIGELSEKLHKIEMTHHQMLELRAADDKSLQEIAELEQQKNVLQQAIKKSKEVVTNELECLQNEVLNSEREFESIRRQISELNDDEKDMANRLEKTMGDIREHQQMIKHKERMNIVITEKYDAALKKMLEDCDNLQDKVNEEQKALSKVETEMLSKYCV